MADDIINIDLNVLPKIDKKGLQELTSQLRNLIGSRDAAFRQTIDSLITPGTYTGLSFGQKEKQRFASLMADISRGQALVDSLAGSKIELPRNVTEKSVKEANDAIRAAKQYFKSLSDIASEFPALLETVNDQERIRDDIYFGRNTHQANVGASRLARERFYSLNALARRAGKRGLVSDEFRELVYSGVEAANNTSILPRASFRFNTREEYSRHATNAVFKMLSGDSSAMTALGQVGLGVGADGSYGENVDPKIYKAATEMIGAITKGREVTEKLNAGGLDKEERAALLDMHKTQNKIFNKGLKILWGTQEQKEMASAIYASQTALNQPASILQQAMGLIGPASVVGAVMNTTGGILEAGWQEDIDRSWQGSVKARTAQMKSTGQLGGGVAGGVAGAGIGALIGFLVGGPAGVLPGARIGGGAGAVAGAGAANWAGTYLEKRLGANIASISYATNQARNEALFGQGYSTALASMINGQGIASGEDVNKMAGNALTLRARMMLGLVGENEMLLYSLMPDYYRANMEGRSQVEIMDAYQRSILGIGDPSLRAFAGMNVGGGSAGMYALANSPYYADARMMAGTAYEYDYLNRMYGEGLVRAAPTREYYSARKTREQVARSAGSIDPFVVAPGYARPTREWLDVEGEALSEEKWYTPTRIVNELLNKAASGFSSSVPVINIYLDSSEIGYAMEVNRGSERLLNVGSN